MSDHSGVDTLGHEPSDYEPSDYQPSDYEPFDQDLSADSEADRKLPVDWVVFGVTAAIVLAIVVWGIVDGSGMKAGTSKVFNWVLANLDWLFLLAATGFVIFALYLAISKYGRVTLGQPGEKPEYSTTSWIAMMFSAGMGIGLMFYGVNEPLTHFVTPPPGSDPGVATAMATTMFHWGFHPWAMYAVVGLSIAYGTYRCGRTQLISAVFAPLFGGNRVPGPVGKVIDILAIFATLFGTVASLGLGASQIGAGMEELNWVTNPGKLLLVAIIAILTLCFVASAVSGVAKGIQLLSNVNMVVALVLAIFVFVVGPTVFILNILPTTLGSYLNDITSMAARSSSEGGSDTAEWLSGWTIFYWAWWVSWTPFVGMFLAKISRGRTIRQFVVGVMIVPSLVSLLWFSIFGGAGISEEKNGLGLSGSDGAEAQLFDMLGNLPLATISSIVVMFLVAIFFVSGADAASIVMGTLSQRGRAEPTRLLVVFWGVLTGGVAAMLLWINPDSLSGLQTMTIIAAVPFVIVMVGMCVSLMMDLRRDPLFAEPLLPAHADPASKLL